MNKISRKDSKHDYEYKHSSDGTCTEKKITNNETTEWMSIYDSCDEMQKRNFFNMALVCLTSSDEKLSSVLVQTIKDGGIEKIADNLKT